MSARNVATAMTDASAAMGEQATYSTLQAVPRGVLQGVAPVAMSMAPRYIMQSQVSALICSAENVSIIKLFKLHQKVVLRVFRRNLCLVGGGRYQ